MVSWNSPSLILLLLRRAAADGNEPAVRTWLQALEIPGLKVQSVYQNSSLVGLQYRKYLFLQTIIIVSSSFQIQYFIKSFHLITPGTYHFVSIVFFQSILHFVHSLYQCSFVDGLQPIKKKTVLTNLVTGTLSFQFKHLYHKFTLDYSWHLSIVQPLFLFFVVSTFCSSYEFRNNNKTYCSILLYLRGMTFILYFL